jgi:excisionase family DNA binding protein
MKTWLTVTESAEYAGVSRDTIYTACERRELRHARVGGRRAIRVKRDWIDAWFEQHARGAQHLGHPDATTPVSCRVEHASRTAGTSRSDGRS